MGLPDGLHGRDVVTNCYSTTPKSAVTLSTDLSFIVGVLKGELFIYLCSDLSGEDHRGEQFVYSAGTDPN